MEGLENDGRQQEEEERIQLDPSWADYWAKREQDMRDQREFWKKWEAKWQS